MRYFYNVDRDDTPCVYPVKNKTFCPMVLNTDSMGLPYNQIPKFKRLARIFSDFFLDSPRVIFFGNSYADRFVDAESTKHVLVGHTSRPGKMLARLAKLIPPDSNNLYMVKTLDIRPKNVGIILHENEFVLEINVYTLLPAFQSTLNALLRKVMIDEILETI